MAIDYELKEVFDISKFTVVGNPTISADGIMTSSADGHIQFPFDTTAEEWRVEYDAELLNTNAGRLIGSDFSAFQMYYVGVNGFDSRLYYDNTYVSIPNPVPTGALVAGKYKFYIQRKNGTYNQGYKPQGGAWVDGTPILSEELPDRNFVDVGQQGNGSFVYDLNTLKYFVDGTEVFKGTKTVVAKIPPEIIGSGSSVPMDYVAALEELQNYYANLLIIQYHNKPKAIGMIKSLVRALYADMILFKIRDGFNIVNAPFAIGKQLDCIGEWVGVNRIYDAGQPLYPWFSLINAEQTTTDVWQGGFQDWNDPIAEDGGFLGFDDLVMGANKTALADDLFLALIKMKIIKNSSTHTMGDLDRKLYEYFGSDIYITWNGMEMTYNYTNQYNAIMEVAKIKNAIPIPNGMIVSYNAL